MVLQKIKVIFYSLVGVLSFALSIAAFSFFGIGPVFASDNATPLDIPYEMYDDFMFHDSPQPLLLSSYFSGIALYGGTVQVGIVTNPNNYRYLQWSRRPSAQASFTISLVVGLVISANEGDYIDFSYTSFGLLGGTTPESSAAGQVSFGFADGPGGQSQVPFNPTSYSIVDQNGVSLYDDLSTGNNGGQVSFVLDHDVSFIGIAVTERITQGNSLKFFRSLDLESTDITITVTSQLDPVRAAIIQSEKWLDSINQAVQQLVVSASGLTPMEQFEADYLENAKDELDAVEGALFGTGTGSLSSLAPEGGFSGFVSDIAEGFGVSSSSFDSSQLSQAAGAFSGSSSTGPGGPWEFFTQAVADSLAGDTSAVGLNDDDYIYAWYDQMQGRWSMWSSSSP